jgi:protein phosphatase
MKCFGITDVGKKRKNNQDCFGIHKLSDDCHIIAVCDGMGGANGGEIASAKAMETFLASSQRDITPESSDDEIRDALFTAIRDANREVFALSEYSEELKGMGTTIVAALVRDNGCDLDSIDHDVKTYSPNGDTPELPPANPCAGVFLAHVGDSRAYLVADELTQLTKDHSLVQYLIDIGELKPEKADHHPQKNIITKAIGVDSTVIPDVEKVFVTERENAYILLCSDGLHSEIKSSDIQRIVHSDKSVEEKCEALVALANKKGGHDNITAVLLEL